jgi:hypothetical protein
MKHLLIAIAALVLASPAVAQQAPKPLFASDDVLALTIRGPISTLVRDRSSSAVAGTLTTASGETLPVALSVRGITRRTTEICSFPPLRVEFTGKPPANSLFAGQHRLKLVTHCRNDASFQQYPLLEYTAYRLYNVLTPASFRVRLANVTYQGEDGRAVTTRVGFFLEDTDDVARRNAMRELHAPARIEVSALNATDAARYAMFQHMIANHDWSMRAGPAGDNCCHNARLIGRSGLATGTVVPLPYDFDFSGFVGAPYATPPDQLRINSVRQRVYRGYCAHNREAALVAAQMRSARPQLMATLAATPGLADGARRRAASFIDQFFALISTDGDTDSKVLKRCLG